MIGNLITYKMDVNFFGLNLEFIQILFEFLTCYSEMLMRQVVFHLNIYWGEGMFNFIYPTNTADTFLKDLFKGRTMSRPTSLQPHAPIQPDVHLHEIWSWASLGKRRLLDMVFDNPHPLHDLVVSPQEVEICCVSGRRQFSQIELGGNCLQFTIVKGAQPLISTATIQGYQDFFLCCWNFLRTGSRVLEPLHLLQQWSPEN